LRELFVKKTDLLPSQILLNSLAIASVILVLIPEFIFLNDPYGGENERMNTIFKIYSSCWALMHLAAFGLFREQIIRYSAISGFSPYYYFPAFVALMLAFLWEIAPVRASKPQSSVAAYGSLAVAEDTFPGSAAAILYLRAQPGGVVLEAQGNAYDWTSFVATLSDKDSFLGWANHVNLLIREYGEIARREAITKEFYTDPSCARRREILEQEKIRFAVVGILEEKQYSGSGARDYSCLTLAYQRGQYRVFRTQ
jgi:uncharacterized membrane protein